jgi:GNAT superfamily N-acetyltransferase
MITYQEEQFEDIVEDIKPILEVHWNELANNKDIRYLDVDYDGYIKLNRIGSWKVFTVRDDDKLIGYSSFLIAHNLHYKDWKFASNDVYYLQKEYRKKGIGYKMFKETERWLKDQGVKSVVVQEKIDHPHSVLFDDLGFVLIERNYEKVL